MITILDLIPQSNEMLLNEPAQRYKTLCLLASMVDNACQSIKSVLARDFYAFDPLVGENLCQIRAYKNYWLFKKYACANNIVQLNNLLMLLKQLKEKTLLRLDDEKSQLTQRRSKVERATEKHLTLNQYVVEHDLFLQLNDDILYFSMTYLLTKFCLRDLDDIPVRINHKDFCDVFSLSSHSGRRLIHYYQKQIASDSCRYIVSLAGIALSTDWQAVATALIAQSDEGRNVLPSFFVGLVIFEHMKKHGLNAEIIYDRLDKDGAKIESSQHCIQVGKKAGHINSDFCYTLYGIGCKGFSDNGVVSVNNIVTFGIKTLLLCNFASHPQYTGKVLEHLAENPFVEFAKHANSLTKSCNELLMHLSEVYEGYRSMARSVGFARENNDLIYIKHIYLGAVRTTDTDSCLVENNDTEETHTKFSKQQ